MGTAFRLDRGLSFLDGLSREQLLAYARRASVDQRTGLLNLDAFKYVAWNDYGEDAYPLPMLVLDLVGLKELNGYGREVGNTALRHVGALVRDATNGTDSRAARIGGDEYAILPPRTAGPVGVMMLHRAISDIERGLPDRILLGRLETQCPALNIQLRYGIVDVRGASARHIDDAIDIALKKAYQEIPITPRV